MNRGLEDDAVIDALDAAYRFGGTDRAWLAGIAKALAPTFDCGLGLISFFYDASNLTRIHVSNAVGIGVSRSTIDEVPQMVNTFSPEQAARLFLGAGHIGTSSEALGIPPISSDDLGQLTRDLIDLGMPRKTLRLAGRAGASEALQLHWHELDSHGVVIAAPRPTPATSSPRFRARWSRVVVPLRSALRLRHRLAQLDAEDDAILEPDGHLADATGPAKARHRRAPDEALELWRGLVLGSWSLVDRVDRDGKRFILARRNAPNTLLHPKLTLREQQVGTAAVLGHSNKLIAYELGVSISTVATHLASAARKLGATSRLALAEQLRDVTRRGAVR